MAKSDSFFIRAILTVDNSETFQQTTIPLGSYVDALGQAVLRIHNVEYEWINTANFKAPFMSPNQAGYANCQITTQTQTGLVSLDNKSVAFKSQLWARNPDASQNPPTQVYNDSHAPQHFTNGYLVAVETLYLGGQADASWIHDIDLGVAVVLECTVEKMSQAAAMALALSQQ